tara:strand:- start:481 stop:1083 length:603 start_codon:yes stop_codon:yes gene_type:complete
VLDLSTKPINGVGTLVIDLETNGLLKNATRIHCAALYWAAEDRTESFNDEKYADSPKDLPMGSGYSITTAVQWIQAANTVVGHNIINFDLPLIKRLYPFFEYPPIIVDTLLLSRLYHPDLYDIDEKFSARKKHKFLKLPDKKYYGSHSLKAWGYRLGILKGDFAETTDWKEWSQEMEDYCVQDVAVTTKLCDHFHQYLIG